MVSVGSFRADRGTFYSGKQFDVNDAILNALKNLEVTLDIDTSVKIDDCTSFQISNARCVLKH